jgi:hypothetical protein
VPKHVRVNAFELGRFPGLRNHLAKASRLNGGPRSDENTNGQGAIRLSVISLVEH